MFNTIGCVVQTPFLHSACPILFLWSYNANNKSNGREGNCTVDLLIGILKIKLAQDHLVLLKVPFPPVLKYVAIKFPVLGRM